MVCLIKSKYKNELAEYKRILGSEPAAYYALAANNGFTLDLDPNGEPSKLYEALLAANGGDKDAAIMRKVSAYMPQFMERYGDWVTEGKNEPSILDVQGGVSTATGDAISSILESPQLKESLKELQKENDLFTRNSLIDYYIGKVRDTFVEEQVNKYIEARTNPSNIDIYALRLGSQIDWDEAKINEIIGEQQQKLAKVFGLTKKQRSDGTFVYTSSDKSKNSRLRIAFVNSISGKDWVDEDGVTHQGVFKDNSKSEEAAWNAIYLSIQEGDATTFVHEMVHYYVYTFWESQPVQDALREISKTKSKDNLTDQEYSKVLEEALVERITLDTMQDFENKANRGLILRFWDGINELLYNLIGKPLKTSPEALNDVIDTLSAAFSINQDLSDRKAETVLYNKYIGPMFQDQVNPTQNEPNELEGTTFWKIKSTLESRWKSEKSRGKQENEDLLNVEYYLQRLQRRSITNKDDISATVADFMLLAAQDIERAIRVLAGIKIGGPQAIQTLDPSEFMHLKYDIIAYYDKMLEDVIGRYIRNNNNISQEDRNIIEQQKNELQSRIATLKTNFNTILEQYVDHQIESYADELLAMGDKDCFVANMKLWARNSINDGDLMPFENSLGPAVISRSPIVRLVEYIVTAQNRATYTAALEVGHDLIDKYKKCASIGKKLMSVNFMKQFCDLDDDGNPTGYFARKYNYGKLYKMRDDIIKKLIRKYNLVVDENTNKIIYKDRDQQIKYMTDFYNEMDKIANFRYKKDYYIQRATLLSPKAVELERQIQAQINILLKKAYNKELNAPVISDLTSDEINQLDELRKEKQNLANPYIIEYNDDGSIKFFAEKEGEALQIAKEFMAWNAWKQDKLKYKSNWEKFNKVRKYLVDKYGEDSPQVKLFDYKNKVKRISSDFYENFKSDDPDAPNTFTGELRELYTRRSIIRNSIMNKKGYYIPNLKKLNDAAFVELKRLDQELTGAGSNSNVDFYMFASKPWVNEYDEEGKLTSEPVFNYFNQLERVKRTATHTPQDLESMYTYVDYKGSTQPLTIFKYTSPINKSYIEEALVGEFSEIDKESDLLNDAFDETEPEELQPKHTEQFINKNWQKIQDDPKLKEFYDTILKVMHDAYSMLPNMNADKMQYVMPQMRDRDAKLLFRNTHFIRNLGASIADAFSITERDTRYNEDFAHRPDGSYVETIPIRWVTRMKDPTILSTDILNTVTMFYEMAQNYRNKADINPLLQTLLFQTQGGFTVQTPGTNTSEQAQRIKTYLQMYVYGRTRTGIVDPDKPMTPREIKASRITDVILSKAHAKLMNHNWRAVLKNFVDSFLTDTGEIFAGKYITVKDALWANKEMANELFSTTASFGRANNKSKIAALMQLNGVSGTISEIFSQHNETWLRRILSKHLSMGEYTLVDYTFKGHYTASVYHSIRLVRNPNTKKVEFMTKDQAMYHYQAAGLRMNDGLKAWKKSKITLFDAYDVDDKGNAVVKEKYKKYVYPHVESLGRSTNRLVNQVAGTIRERTSVINGILDASGSARAKQSTIGSMVLQMRGWMISQMWDNLKDGHDFAEYQETWRTMFNQQQDETISQYIPGAPKRSNNQDNLKYKIVEEDPELRGMYNFETGTIETGQWRGLSSSSIHALQDLLARLGNAYKAIRNIENSEEYKKKLTRNERYKLRRLSTMAATFIIVAGCSYITVMTAAKWPEKWWLNLIAASNISVISERASQLPVFAPLSILDIVNSIVISKTLVEDADKFWNSINDILEVSGFYQLIDYTPEHSYNEEVKSGAYKGIERWQRDWLKFMSYTDYNIDNVFRSMSKSGNDASINYYLHNVAPTKQAYGASEAVMPALLNFAGIQFDEPPKQNKGKKSQKKHVAE